jgi:hypothetical protein
MRLTDLLRRALTTPHEPTTERVGRCLCGTWLIDHFDAENRKRDCVVAPPPPPACAMCDEPCVAPLWILNERAAVCSETCLQAYFLSMER